MMGRISSRSTRRGVTLLEVLAAIFIAGVGLLALLVLFPLGALNMARAIQDDRAAAVAADAGAFSEKGQELLMRTRQFVLISLLNGVADPKTVSTLRIEYAELSTQASSLEARIAELRPLAKTRRAKRLVNQVLAEIRTIRAVIDRMSELFELLQPNPQ